MKERRYFPFELKAMFAQAGLRVDHVWGGSLGKSELRQNIQWDAIEIMVTATLP
ncbi:hypothetical protein [Paenibacillus mesotrionivorans]|uniref:Uncharacterized protein n=1 Tax=Paenibacillus mesotrionivorans TaxID=3160968 RepID=A0ACC7P2H3_9BACL